MASQAPAASSNKIGLLRLARENFAACKLSLEQAVGAVTLALKKGTESPRMMDRETAGGPSAVRQKRPETAVESHVQSARPEAKPRNINNSRVASRRDYFHDDYADQDINGLDATESDALKLELEIKHQIAQLSAEQVSSNSPAHKRLSKSGMPLPNVPSKNPKRYRLSRSSPLFAVPLTLPIHDSPPSRQSESGTRRLTPSPLRIRKMRQRRVSGQWLIHEDDDVEADAGGKAGDSSLSDPTQNTKRKETLLKPLAGDNEVQSGRKDICIFQDKDITSSEEHNPNALVPLSEEDLNSRAMDRDPRRRRGAGRPTMISIDEEGEESDKENVACPVMEKATSLDRGKPSPGLLQSSAGKKLTFPKDKRPAKSHTHGETKPEEQQSLVKTTFFQNHQPSLTQLQTALNDMVNRASADISRVADLIESAAMVNREGMAIETKEQRVQRLRAGGWKEVGLRRKGAQFKGCEYYRRLCRSALAEAEEASCRPSLMRC